MQNKERTIILVIMNSAGETVQNPKETNIFHTFYRKLYSSEHEIDLL